MINLTIPKKDAIVDGGITLASLAGGFIVANTAKMFLMEPKADGSKAIVEDSVTLNVVASLATAGASIMIPTDEKKKKNMPIKLGLMAMSMFFAVRSINKVTDKLTGLGNDGQPSAIKEFLSKYIPRLGGIGEISDANYTMPTIYLPENAVSERRITQQANNGKAWA